MVKGTRFRDHRIVGDIVPLARRYSDEGADELVFYDISASPDGRSVSRDWVRDAASVIDIPFCVAGGIRSCDDALEVLQNGADKVSINSPALADPNLIDTLAKRFGSQCVVVGIDSFRGADGSYRVHANTGDPDKSHDTSRKTLEWLSEVQQRGAGEVVLNCMNEDGVRQGYDLEQLKLVQAQASIPVIASGGAGTMAHFRDVFRTARVSGALAASVFHSEEIAIADLKAYLAGEGIEVRQ